MHRRPDSGYLPFLQVLGYDIVTLELVFSVMTHPAPGSSFAGGSEDMRTSSVPLALGPRWLAYAANQASPRPHEPSLLSCCGQA